MSYQVLARKWRPQAFDEVVGQGHVTTPLRNAIQSGRVPHAVLLAGPRGVGKTTLARILARCLNCDEGPTDAPCGRCPSCREIAAGTSTDVQEIDAASRTSVDDVRELIEAVRYAPTPGKHRIYVVDEVHMLSLSAFNALLKTLEEPPPHTLFVFATTNPGKIPFTVVSRCQRYDLKRLPTAEIAGRLTEIARSEGIAISETSLRAVAREGDGSLRDAMTLLDQIISSGGTEVDDQQVGELLDLIDRRLLLRLATACVEGDPAAALAAVGDAASGGLDPKRLAGALMQLLRDLLVLRIAPDGTELVDGSDAEIADLRSLAERCEPARLRRMFRALLREQEDLSWAPAPYAVLEMALVRLATLPPGDEVSALLARLDALERRLSGAVPSGGAGASGGGGAAGPPPEPSVPAPAPQAPPEVVFDRLRGVIQGHDRALAASLEGGRLLERTDSRLRLQVPKRFAATRLVGRRKELEVIAERFFGRRLSVEIEHAEADATEGARGRLADDEVARRKRQEALGNAGVNAVLEILGGEIVEIRPLGGSK